MSIARIFAQKFANYHSDTSIAFKFRQKRSVILQKLISACFRRYGKVDIIDIGGTRVYWNIIPFSFLLANHVKIVVVNLASGVSLPENDEVFEFQKGDGCHLAAFKENTFTIAHSNSVIEHVGCEVNRVKFAEEMKRVAVNYFIQTPNYWFPFEPHFFCPFFQWLPEKFQIFLIMHFDLGWIRKAMNLEDAMAKINSCRLLRKNELKKLFPDATIYKEKFMLLTKSFMVIRQIT